MQINPPDKRTYVKSGRRSPHRSPKARSNTVSPARSPLLELPSCLTFLSSLGAKCAAWGSFPNQEFGLGRFLLLLLLLPLPLPPLKPSAARSSVRLPPGLNRSITHPTQEFISPSTNARALAGTNGTTMLCRVQTKTERRLGTGAKSETTTTTTTKTERSRISQKLRRETCSCRPANFSPASSLSPLSRRHAIATVGVPFGLLGLSSRLA